MHKTITLAVLGAALTFGTAFAATHSGTAMNTASPASADKPVGKQQSKMAHCNADAKEKSLKGAERKQFMSSCLSSKKAKSDKAA